jgi:hypothetical protein
LAGDFQRIGGGRFHVQREQYRVMGFRIAGGIDRRKDVADARFNILVTS